MNLKKEFLLDEFNSTSYSNWKEKVLKDLRGKDFNSLKTTTYDNLTLEPIYDVLENKKILSNYTLPGIKNFKRGKDFGSRNLANFTITQPNFESNCKEFNKNISKDLMLGLNSITTGINTSSRDLSIKSYSHFAEAFENIDLEAIQLNLIVEDNSKNILEIFEKYLIDSQISKEKLKANILISPYQQIIFNGKIPKEKNNIQKYILQHFELMKKMFPNKKSFLIDSSLLGDAGGNAVQEIAFALSSAVEIFDFLNDKFDNQLIADNMIFQFSLSPFFINDIAKIRAFRILFSNVLEEFGVEKSDNKIWGKSNLFYRTNSEEYTNVLRATSESFAGILSQVDQMLIYPHNFRTENPNDFARRISRNTQTILTEESHLNSVVDSGGGSYYLENLTNQLAISAWELFQKVESNGGFFESLKTGFIQNSVNQIRKRKIEDVNKRKLSLIGTNVYVKNDSEFSITEIPNKYFTNENIVTEEIPKLDFSHAGKHFEELKIFVRNQKDKSIKIIGIGEVSEAKPRIDFAKQIFETAGFEIEISSSKISTKESLLKEITESRNKIVVLASSNQNYEELIFNNSIKFKTDSEIILSGLPKEKKEEFVNCGITDFVFAGMDVFSFLKKISEKIYGEK